MNMVDEDEERGSPDDWSWTAAPAIPSKDGRIFVKLLAYDGEYPVSWVYEHPNVTQPGATLYQADAWLSDLWRASDGRLFAAAEGGQVHAFNGERWQVVQTPATSMIASVWGVDDRTIYATTEGAIFQLLEDAWQLVTSGHQVYIDRIHGLTADNIYAVGRRGLMLHFDGRAWRRLDVPTGMDLNAVRVTDRGTVIAVGVGGTVLEGNADRWSALQFEDIDFLDVVDYRGSVFLAAGYLGIFRLDGKGLVPFRTDIHVVRLTTGADVFCAAGDLSFHCFDGREWQTYSYKIE